MMRPSLSILALLAIGGLVQACGSGDQANDPDGSGGLGLGGDDSTDVDDGSGGDPGDKPSTGGDEALGGSSTGGAPGSGGESSGGSDPGGGGMGGEGSGGAPPVSVQDEVCSADGWCWMAPLPHGHSFRAIAENSEQLWAVGEGGLVVHEDSGEFFTRHLPGYPLLEDVAFVGETIWIVGEGGLLLEQDGDTYVAIDLGVEDDLRAIHVLAPDDVWVGGGAALFHFNGSDWTDHSSGISSVATIGGLSSTDLYVGGTGPSGAMRHFDGTDWDYETDLLIRVSGARSFTDIEAHDGKLYVSSDYTDGYLWVKDGETWSHLALGYPRPVWDLKDAGTFLWAAGEAGLMSVEGETTTEQIDFLPFEQGPMAVSASDATVTATLHGGRLTRRSGADFTTVYGEDWPGIGEDGSFTVSAGGQVTWGRITTIEGEPGSWTETSIPSPWNSVGFWQGQAGVWMVNDDTVYLREAASWSPQFTGAGSFFRGWEAPTGEIFIVGSTRTAWFDGTDWAEFETTQGASRIEGSAANHVWKIGNGIWRWDGTTWNNEADPELNGENFEGLEVLSETSVWLGSTTGNFYHFDGSDWTQHATDPPMFVRDIAAIAEDDIWAAGRGFADDYEMGYVAHWDGSSWTIQDTGCARELMQVIVRDENTVWVGGNGSLLRWERD